MIEFQLDETSGVATYLQLVQQVHQALAATPAIMIAVEGAVIAWVRLNLIAPVRVASPLNLAAVQAEGAHVGAPVSSQLYVQAGFNPPGGWVYSSQVLSASGRTSLGPEPRVCASGTWQECLNALGRLHLRQVVTYQPASRYWPLQWAETSLFLALALLLAGFCFWWIRHHLPG